METNLKHNTCGKPVEAHFDEIAGFVRLECSHCNVDGCFRADVMSDTGVVRLEHKVGTPVGNERKC